MMMDMGIVMGVVIMNMAWLVVFLMEGERQCRKRKKLEDQSLKTINLLEEHCNHLRRDISHLRHVNDTIMKRESIKDQHARLDPFMLKGQ
jgi:hypothetical protein